MSVDPVQIGLAAAAVFLFLRFFPAPEGCGCAARKRALERAGGELFGA